MNCPDCHCPRGEPLTVATNSLVTRCHHAFHAVAVSPARPDDFVTETAKDTAPPHPTHSGAAEVVDGATCRFGHRHASRVWADECLHDGIPGEHLKARIVAASQKSTESTEVARDLPDPQTYKPTPEAAWLARHLGIDLGHRDPFDPNPRPLIPAENGWIFCATCESPQPVSGHPCGIEKSVQWMHEEMPRLRADLEAAEADLDRAEVVKDLALSHLVGAEARAEFAESLLCATVFGHGLAYGTCRCDFCNIIRDAARGGGR